MAGKIEELRGKAVGAGLALIAVGGMAAACTPAGGFAGNEIQGSLVEVTSGTSAAKETNGQKKALEEQALAGITQLARSQLNIGECDPELYTVVGNDGKARADLVCNDQQGSILVAQLIGGKETVIGQRLFASSDKSKIYYRGADGSLQEAMEVAPASVVYVFSDGARVKFDQEAAGGQNTRNDQVQAAVAQLEENLTGNIVAQAQGLEVTKTATATVIPTATATGAPMATSEETKPSATPISFFLTPDRQFSQDELSAINKNADKIHFLQDWYELWSKDNLKTPPFKKGDPNIKLKIFINGNFIYPVIEDVSGGDLYVPPSNNAPEDTGIYLVEGENTPFNISKGMEKYTIALGSDGYLYATDKQTARRAYRFTERQAWSKIVTRVSDMDPQTDEIYDLSGRPVRYGIYHNSVFVDNEKAPGFGMQDTAISGVLLGIQSVAPGNFEGIDSVVTLTLGIPHQGTDSFDTFSVSIPTWENKLSSPINPLSEDKYGHAIIPDKAQMASPDSLNNSLKKLDMATGKHILILDVIPYSKANLAALYAYVIKLRTEDNNLDGAKLPQWEAQTIDANYACLVALHSGMSVNGQTLRTDSNLIYANY